MEISLHMSISLSFSRFPSLLFPPKSKPQQQQNPPPPLLLHNPNPKISTGDLHRPSAIKRSGLLSAIDHAIEEEEEYRKARAEVNRKGIDARGYVIEGFSVGGHETCVVIPALNSVFDIGRCPSRAVHQDFLFITHAHLDHILLKHARQLGDFLLVGIHSDQTVSECRGTHHPIMNLHERSLSVLACRYVDEVIIGAPWAVTKDMTTTFNIYLVVRGTVSDSKYLPDFLQSVIAKFALSGDVDPYAAPKSMGIFRMIESPRDTAAASVAKRIVANHDIYKKRNEKKGESEKRYYAEKKFVYGD